MRLTAGAVIADILKVFFLLAAFILLIDAFFVYFQDGLAFARESHKFLSPFASIFRFTFFKTEIAGSGKMSLVWNSLISGIIFLFAHFMVELLQRKYYEKSEV